MLTVSALTSLGFMLIGFDNGLMGGLVGAPAFNKTFNKPSPNMIGTIVAIFESKICHNACLIMNLHTNPLL